MTTSGHNVGLEEEKPMNDTPRTDAAYFKKGATMYDLAGEMKRMERELNAATSEIERLRKSNLQLREGAEEQKHRIKRLEEAGGQLMMWIGEDISDSNRQLLEDHWNKAKEDKP